MIWFTLKKFYQAVCSWGGRQRRYVPGAFTLIELLVSISILGSVLLLVSQLVNGVSKTTLRAGKLMDCDNEARLIFAKMEEDFKAIVYRPEVNYYFKSQSGNDTFYFYSHTVGHFDAQETDGTSSALLDATSLVGYRVSNTVSGSDRVELERLGRGLHWLDPGVQTAGSGQASTMLFLPTLIKDAFAAAIADPYNNSSNPNSASSTSDVPQWDVIGGQVFRMEFCFLLKDGSFSSMPIITDSSIKSNLSTTMAPGKSDDVSAGYTIGSRWYDTTSQVAYCCTCASTEAALWTPLGLQDVKAVAVTIALLDTKSRLNTNSTAIKSAVAAMGDFTSGASTAKAWMIALNDVKTFAKTTGLNPSAVASIRVYERCFYFN